ncbi:protein CYSTEINE-RICH TRANSMEMBRANE MODULE 9-like [Miscanthus floridulus]|uniref:protein CYSTEINE-RICH TRANSMEMBRANE MODULE 9-like n=1 Tax=Miscanthus floridulus TaxID=154761 RepID=UPI003459C4B0
MSYYNQQQAPVTAYPPAGQPYVQPPPMQATYVQPAPPPGYPGSYNSGMTNPPPLQVVAPQTQSRGDKAFWEGCCAALCCCCILDMCC